MNVPVSDTVTIPGTFFFSRTYDVPSSLISLPIRASTRAVPMLLFSALYAALIFPGVLLIYGIYLNLGNCADRISSYFSLLFVLICACMIIACCGTALTCFWDAMRALPVLHVGRDGLNDKRTDIDIAWESISRAEILYTKSGIGCIRIILKSHVKVHQNYFRIGMCAIWKLKPNELRVPVGYLDRDAYTLAHAILSLVRRHGGVGEASRWE